MRGYGAYSKKLSEIIWGVNASLVRGVARTFAYYKRHTSREYVCLAFILSVDSSSCSSDESIRAFSKSLCGLTNPQEFAGVCAVEASAVLDDDDDDQVAGLLAAELRTSCMAPMLHFPIFYLCQRAAESDLIFFRQGYANSAVRG